MNKPKVTDISKPAKQFATIDPDKLTPLPYPYDDWEEPPIPNIPDDKRADKDVSLDGVLNPVIPIPQTDEEKEKLVAEFLQGLKNLLDKKNNWTFLQPLLLSLENCVRCNTCAEACPIFEASGRLEIYRPLFRSEILRKIAAKYIKPGGKLSAKFTGSDIDLNWETIARLAQFRGTVARMEIDHDYHQ